MAARTPARPATPHACTDEAAFVLDAPAAVPEEVPLAVLDVVPDEVPDADVEAAEAEAEDAALDNDDAALDNELALDEAEEATAEVVVGVSPKRLAAPTIPP